MKTFNENEYRHLRDKRNIVTNKIESAKAVGKRGTIALTALQAIFEEVDTEMRKMEKHYPAWPHRYVTNTPFDDM